MNLQVNTVLKLPTSSEAAVYRAIVARLMTDPVLSREIGPDNWQTWNGDPRSKKPLAKRGPAIRLTPTGGGSGWWSPGSQVGPLIIAVELSVPTAAADDVMNLWGAIRTAIYPADPLAKAAVALSFQNAGAQDGLVTFSMPAFDPGPDEDGDGSFHALGQMKIDVRSNT